MSSSSQTSETNTSSSTKKRELEDDSVSYGPIKKQKTLSEQEQQEGALCRMALPLKDALLRPKGVLFKKSSLADNLEFAIDEICEACDEISDNKHVRVASTLALLNAVFDHFADDTPPEALTAMERLTYASARDRVKTRLKTLYDLYKELLAADNSPPSASHYAKPGVWLEWQKKPTAILNMRPSFNQGLPISVLHPIFARFRATLQHPSPDTTDPLIHHVAFDLCTKMADAYGDERARLAEFEKCIKPLFPERTRTLPRWTFQKEVYVQSQRELHASKAGLLIFYDSIPVIGIEAKLEHGDAYMQLSRLFQTWISQQRETKSSQIPQGAPMIFVGVVGPQLIVAGGCFDGKSVVVEPLGDPCWMLPDSHHQRQERLMSVLIAIKEGVKSLASLDYTLQTSFEPGTPRVYTDFTFKNKIYMLNFKQRLPLVTRGPNGHLLFLASSNGLPQQLLVKLVAGDRYGVDAHRKLAEAGFSPVLFDVVKVKGAPAAYIMEYIPSSDGWDTLYDYAKKHQDVTSHIQSPLKQITDFMEKENIVHGDLRPNNILVRQAVSSQALELKVVDFDWAGVAGEARYPWRRNEGISWPAGPGEPILPGHDYALLMACLKQIHEV